MENATIKKMINKAFMVAMGDIFAMKELGISKEASSTDKLIEKTAYVGLALKDSPDLLAGFFNPRAVIGMPLEVIGVLTWILREGGLGDEFAQKMVKEWVNFSRRYADGVHLWNIASDPDVQNPLIKRAVEAYRVILFNILSKEDILNAYSLNKTPDIGEIIIKCPAIRDEVKGLGEDVAVGDYLMRLILEIDPRSYNTSDNSKAYNAILNIFADLIYENIELVCDGIGNFNIKDASNKGLVEEWVNSLVDNARKIDPQKFNSIPEIKKRFKEFASRMPESEYIQVLDKIAEAAFWDKTSNNNNRLPTLALKVLELLCDDALEMISREGREIPLNIYRMASLAAKSAHVYEVPLEEVVVSKEDKDALVAVAGDNLAMFDGGVLGVTLEDTLSQLDPIRSSDDEIINALLPLVKGGNRLHYDHKQWESRLKSIMPELINRHQDSINLSHAIKNWIHLLGDESALDKMMKSPDSSARLKVAIAKELGYFPEDSIKDLKNEDLLNVILDFKMHEKLGVEETLNLLRENIQSLDKFSLPIPQVKAAESGDGNQAHQNAIINPHDRVFEIAAILIQSPDVLEKIALLAKDKTFKMALLEIGRYLKPDIPLTPEKIGISEAEYIEACAVSAAWMGGEWVNFLHKEILRATSQAKGPAERAEIIQAWLNSGLEFDEASAKVLLQALPEDEIVNSIGARPIRYFEKKEISAKDLDVAAVLLSFYIANDCVAPHLICKHQEAILKNLAKDKIDLQDINTMSKLLDYGDTEIKRDILNLSAGGTADDINMAFGKDQKIPDWAVVTKLVLHDVRERIDLGIIKELPDMNPNKSIQQSQLTA